MSRTTSIAALAATAAVALAGCATSQPNPSTPAAASVASAQAVPPTSMGCSPAVQQTILQRINEARQAGLCGDSRLGTAKPLTWQPALAATASKRAGEIAQRGSFGHTTDVTARLRQDGYQPSAAQESQAAGDYSTEGATLALLGQQKQCTTLLNPNFTDIGAACVTRPGTEFKNYWTVVVAKGTPTRSAMGAAAAKKKDVAKKDVKKASAKSKATVKAKGKKKPKGKAVHR